MMDSWSPTNPTFSSYPNQFSFRNFSSSSFPVVWAFSVLQESRLYAQPKVIRELSLVRCLSGRLRAPDHNPIRHPLRAGS
ncbi:hypothetical protein CEXT_485601 [Caerostris extrusa]|uniref:Uncharacterized protein n=1 Tax=Caerostris extrusa TaxID=172846 RepID=A0AAV4VZX8_CAEEX|nr:hypothetical protein CEXT_485601 [Caerostris extrusa]